MSARCSPTRVNKRSIPLRIGLTRKYRFAAAKGSAAAELSVPFRRRDEVVTQRDDALLQLRKFFGAESACLHEAHAGCLFAQATAGVGQADHDLALVGRIALAAD